MILAPVGSVARAAAVSAASLFLPWVPLSEIRELIDEYDEHAKLLRNHADINLKDKVAMQDRFMLDERAIRSLSARSASACLQLGASFRTQTHRGDAAAAEQPLSLRTTLPLD
eukprot:COSAG06_NODE_2909_length_6103_cov_502.645570_1_plen_113_part_00